MDSDLVSLLIYVALALVGVIASAAKNKAKKQQSANRPHVPQVPRTFKADPERDMEPDLGPLMELFDIPRSETKQREYESVENGPTVEEAGMQVDTVTPGFPSGSQLDTPVSEVEKTFGTVESFEEGQSDIQKMIARYDAIRKQLDEEGSEDEIARGEIVSVEAENQIAALKDTTRFFDPRKAIIYSEILKRREY